jgi:hypothetical protein
MCFLLGAWRSHSSPCVFWGAHQRRLKNSFPCCWFGLEGLVRMWSSGCTPICSLGSVDPSPCRMLLSVNECRLSKGKKLFEHNFFVWALTGVISVYLVTSLLVCSVTLLLPCIQCEFWLTLSITTSLSVYGSIVRSMIISIVLRTYILIALYWNLNYRQCRDRVEASSWLRQGICWAGCRAKGWRATERGSQGCIAGLPAFGPPVWGGPRLL